jgi:ribosomal protein L16/L10AE
MVISKSKTSTERKYQKNRFFKNPKKIKINFGDAIIINLKEGRLELIQINSIKKFLKKLIKKKIKKLSFNRERIWYFGKPNFYIQRKSKNSRMGKGKGLPERKVLRLKKNFIIFEFYGINMFKLK